MSAGAKIGHRAPREEIVAAIETVVNGAPFSLIASSSGLRSGNLDRV
jgi:hypothetical protein